ncbi:MAG TPA: hypothetical protein VFT22_33285 [Kofleriaceae bacterium]|nr:hypothetical protein [Kofleriaceae bacterium]
MIRKRFEGTSFDSDAFDATPSTIRLGLGRQRFVAASSAASANHPVAWTSLDLG